MVTCDLGIGVAAVDEDVLSGHKIAVGAGQKDERPKQVLRKGVALQRAPGQNVLARELVGDFSMSSIGFRSRYWLPETHGEGANARLGGAVSCFPRRQRLRRRRVRRADPSPSPGWRGCH
jgi:hypothetical protein